MEAFVQSDVARNLIECLGVRIVKMTSVGKSFQELFAKAHVASALDAANTVLSAHFQWPVHDPEYRGPKSKYCPKISKKYCTSTCVKYQKKKNAAEDPQRAGQKIAGPGVPKCRFRYFRYVALLIGGMLKYVVRRGRELVKRAFIATGNEENEFGKAIVPRQGPFRSSSGDVLQSTLRCNADYQYQKRAVPDMQMRAEPQYQHQEVED